MRERKSCGGNVHVRGPSIFCDFVSGQARLTRPAPARCRGIEERGREGCAGRTRAWTCVRVQEQMRSGIQSCAQTLPHTSTNHKIYDPKSKIEPSHDRCAPTKFLLVRERSDVMQLERYAQSRRTAP